MPNEKGDSNPNSKNIKTTSTASSIPTTTTQTAKNANLTKPQLIALQTENIIDTAVLDALQEISGELNDANVQDEYDYDWKKIAKKFKKSRSKSSQNQLEDKNKNNSNQANSASTLAWLQKPVKKLTNWLSAEYGQDTKLKNGETLNAALKRKNLAAPSSMIMAESYRKRKNVRQKTYEKKLEEWKFKKSIGIREKMPTLEDVPMYSPFIEKISSYKIERFLILMTLFIICVCYPIVIFNKGPIAIRGRDGK